MEENDKKLNFLEEIIENDLASGKVPAVLTRFPPEPNGYLHLGHAKSLCINFGLAMKYGGKTNLRYDDTNPVKEDTEYVDAIKEDIQWLGFRWEKECYASDYFDQLYEWAEDLIKRGLAYVDDQTQEEISKGRGTVDKPGVESPYRNRSVEENLQLFREMRDGKYADGEKVLRAKIDMAHPNMMMRDPLLYRIKHASHHRTGDKWCIYPMYDFTHGQCDSIEHITHSICTLEFDVHRPLYDWFIETLGIYPSHQYEFARLNLTYTLMSKRKLLELVQKGLVAGWDDPRMPTLCGMRRRGYPAEAVRTFCEGVGVTKFISTTDVGILEQAVRDVLNRTAARRMAVLDPVKLVIDNLPEGETHECDAVNNPEDPAAGTRKVRFGRELWVERADFMKDPPKKFYRLAVGREVRLKYACLFTCTGVVEDAQGNVTEIHGTWDPASLGGNAPDGHAVRGTIHWVDAATAVPLPVRLYDRLFQVENPDADADRDFKEFLNPDSCREATALCEPALRDATSAGGPVQFERLGYFFPDPVDSKPGAPVFNRTSTLRDSWAKIAKK